MKRIVLFILILLFFQNAIHLQNEKKAKTTLIIDADTANEIDDLYAIVRAIIAPELNVLAITSAHFVNSPLASDSTVIESQILNEAIINAMNVRSVDLPLGSNAPLDDENSPQPSQAADYIIQKAHEMPDGERLHIIILGPCTNVASAILLDSTIVDKIEVSYIGFWHNQEKKTWSRLEFNSGNDIKAVNVLLTTPGLHFYSMTATTSGKLIFDKKVARNELHGRGGVKSMLYNRWLNHQRWWKNEDVKKKKWTMWDVAIIEALIHPENATLQKIEGPKPNTGKKINVYTGIDVEAMKSSFWTAIEGIKDENNSKYLVKNVSIVLPSEGRIVPHQDVTVEYGKISKISETGNTEATEDLNIIDGKGKYIMPGLSEMHAHIPVPNEELGEDHVQDMMHLYLANGVTLIRGMLGHPYHLELKKKIRSGEIIGPRMYTSSPSMNGNSVPDADTAREKVKEAKKKGYDFLKIHPGIKADVMKIIVETANETGIGFAGHVPFNVGIHNALKYQYETVDHADGYVRGLVNDSIQSEEVGFFGHSLVKKVKLKELPELAQMTKDNQVWQVPTQSLFTRWFSPVSAAEMMSAQEFAYIPPKTRYAWRTNKEKMISDKSYSKKSYRKFMRIRKMIIQSLHQAGVPFLLGSDSPQVMNVPGFSIHHEIAALNDCGLSSFDIIKMGTTNPALFFDEIELYGSIKEGVDADFILIEHNPYNRLETMKLPLGTMKDGKWMDRSYFNEVLQIIEEKLK